MKLLTVVANAIARIRASFVTDVDAIVASFHTLSAKLEVLIDKGLVDLENTTHAMEILKARQTALNAEVDRAYRVLHKVSDLVS